jgi:hypothetical protein
VTFLRHILTGTDNRSFELAETLVAALGAILVVFTVWDYWVRGHDFRPEVTIGAGSVLVGMLGAVQRLRGDPDKPPPDKGS